ncbi:MAG: Hsp20/alpha crystallin family protein [Bacillota bacterium]|nr:Hsp20/alpha crystallin family protein [Bacillota bacterium]
MFDLIPFGRSDKNLFNYFDSMERNLMKSFGDGMAQFRADIIDKGDKYMLQAELPGFDKKDIKIDIRDNYLTVTAEHSEENETKSNDFVRRERRYGSFSRGFDISDIDEEKIKASYKDGILELDLPKKDPKPRLKGRSINID